MPHHTQTHTVSHMAPGCRLRVVLHGTMRWQRTDPKFAHLDVHEAEAEEHGDHSHHGHHLRRHRTQRTPDSRLSARQVLSGIICACLLLAQSRRSVPSAYQPRVGEHPHGVGLEQPLRSLVHVLSAAPHASLPHQSPEPERRLNDDVPLPRCNGSAKLTQQKRCIHHEAAVRKLVE